MAEEQATVEDRYLKLEIAKLALAMVTSTEYSPGVSKSIDRTFVVYEKLKKEILG